MKKSIIFSLIVTLFSTLYATAQIPSTSPNEDLGGIKILTNEEVQKKEQLKKEQLLLQEEAKKKSEEIYRLSIEQSKLDSEKRAKRKKNKKVGRWVLASSVTVGALVGFRIWSINQWNKILNPYY